MAPPSLPLRLTVRQASAEDLDAVTRLLHDAYDWLLINGITDQWPAPFPSDSIEELIDQGEVYVATHREAVIGTFTLTYAPDPELWRHASGDDAGYVRRLAVDRAYAGNDIGGQLLDRAAELVAAAGRPWLRLDCAKNNERLHTYYDAHAFNRIGTVDLAHRQSGALYQRRAGA